MHKMKMPTKRGSKAGIKTISKTNPDCTAERYLDGNLDFYARVCSIIAQGARNTQQLADNRPDSAVSSCPDYRFYGYGRDGRIGNDRRTSNCVFRTSRPPCNRRKLHGALKPQLGANRMAHATSPTTPTITVGNTSHDHAALILRASNHLTLALRELRQAPDPDGIRKATGRAVAASRALKQLAGGAQ